MQVENTIDTSGLVRGNSLFVQVAELHSDGSVSKSLLNRTVHINVPYLSLQDKGKCSNLLV